MAGAVHNILPLFNAGASHGVNYTSSRLTQAHVQHCSVRRTSYELAWPDIVWPVVVIDVVCECFQILAIDVERSGVHGNPVLSRPVEVNEAEALVCGSGSGGDASADKDVAGARIAVYAA